MVLLRFLSLLVLTTILVSAVNISPAAPVSPQHQRCIQADDWCSSYEAVEMKSPSLAEQKAVDILLKLSERDPIPQFPDDDGTGAGESGPISSQSGLSSSPQSSSLPLPTISPDSATTSTPQPSQPPGSSPSNATASTNAQLPIILGSVIGGAVLVALLVIFIVIMCRRRRSDHPNSKKVERRVTFYRDRMVRTPQVPADEEEEDEARDSHEPLTGASAQRLHPSMTEV